MADYTERRDGMDREGTRGEIKRAVTAYGAKKYEEGFKDGVETTERRLKVKYNSVTEVVEMAYQEGRDKAEKEYEELIQKVQDEKDAMRERIMYLEAQLVLRVGKDECDEV